MGIDITDNNLLLRLHRYASRQDENFVTEAFAHLLDHLIQYEPVIAINILNRLTDSRFIFDISQIESIEIKTQAVTDQGKPDIEIRAIDFLFFIEVKIESEFGDKQISRYRNELNKSGTANTLLATITKYPYPFYQVDPNEKPDIDMRWHQIVDWIEKENPSSEITKLLCNQFINFSKGRNMAMEKVNWDLVGGIKSFINLRTMIREALMAQKIQLESESSAMEYMGSFFHFKDNKSKDNRFFVGLDYKKPNIVYIETAFDSDKSEIKSNIQLGEYRTKSNGKIRWYNSLDLETEECHFFARTKASQLKCLEEFIKKSVNFITTTLLI
ncbi:MAG: PD-(D/E)XK nuclease family protein [Nitrospirae bacterium]|nr:PD-(D/E)XK nuclease family protein [Nitrospirota bacterium]